MVWYEYPLAKQAPGHLVCTSVETGAREIMVTIMQSHHLMEGVK